MYCIQSYGRKVWRLAILDHEISNRSLFPLRSGVCLNEATLGCCLLCALRKRARFASVALPPLFFDNCKLDYFEVFSTLVVYLVSLFQ